MLNNLNKTLFKIFPSRPQLIIQVEKNEESLQLNENLVASVSYILKFYVEFTYFQNSYRFYLKYNSFLIIKLQHFNLQF